MSNNTNTIYIRTKVDSTNLPTEILTKLLVANKSNLFNESLFSNRASLKMWNINHEVYCRLIASCITDNNTHNFMSNTYDLGGQNELTKLFGDHRKFARINDKCVAFSATGSYAQGKSNMAYTLSDKFLRLLETLLDTDLPVTKLTKWATHIPTEFDDKSYCSITGHDLSKFIVEDTHNAKDRLYAWALRESYRAHDNKIPQYYKKGTKTDRLYGVGALSIQRLPRAIRHYVMSDYIEYDLSAASYTILLGLAKDQNLYPTIQQYVQNVREFRADIAQNTDATIEDVKSVFLHKSFGSALTFKSGIAKEISIEIINQVKQHKLFKAFNDELQILKDELANLYPEKMEEFKNSRDVYDEKHTKAGQFKGTYKATYFCWLYQKTEVKIIQLIREELDNQDDCLLLHDAIFTKQKLDKPTLEKLIELEFGFKIKIG